MAEPSEKRTERSQGRAAKAPAVRSDTLRKAVDALAVVPTRQRIYPLARKLYNVLLYLAQAQGLEREVYQATLAEILQRAHFTSNDQEIVKNHLRQMNSTSVEWQSPTKGEGSRWDVSSLIAHAAIIEGVRGRNVTVEWSFAPNIKRELLDPQRFARISLIFQASLRTHASMALFEICSRYLTNPGRLTPANTWEWWRPVLTGVPESEESAYPEYKYFKRDVLKPAVAEINRVTDIKVELIEHRQGRRINNIQFRIEANPQTSLPLTRQPSFDLALVARAVRLGVTQLTAESLLDRHGEDAFGRALQLLDDRLRAPRGAAVNHRDRYLGAVLKRMEQEPKPPRAAPPRREEPARPEAPSREALEARWRDLRRNEAMEVFYDLPEPQRVQTLQRFREESIAKSPQVVRRAFERTGLAAGPVRIQFTEWYADGLYGPGWKEPTSEELLALVTNPDRG